MTATYTDQGAIKVAPTPTGPTTAEDAISVVIASDQRVTPDTQAIVGAIEMNTELLKKILLALT
jgi:hypothetical protein